MTRTQATGILTVMLITVEASGLSKHLSLDFRSYNAELTIFIKKEDSTTPEQIKSLLKDMVPDGMTVEASIIAETLTNFVSYKLDY